MTQANPTSSARLPRGTLIKSVFAVAVLVFLAAVDWFADGVTARLVHGSHQVTIDSDPRDAEVIVNGEAAGKTPLTLDYVRPRTIEVALRHPYHEPQSSINELRGGDPARIEVSFPASSGSLYVLTNPRGASIRLDGELLSDTAPIRVTDLATGPHTLQATLGDRRPTEARVEVFPGRETKHQFELSANLTGTLNLSTTPEDARVEFLDADFTYPSDEPIPAGRYLVRVSADGFHPVERYFDITSSGTYRSVTLERAYGHLTVSATPADAFVRVTYDLGGESHVRDYFESQLVPVGPVRVKASAMGYRNFDSTRHMDTNGLDLAIELQRLKVTAGDQFRDELKSGGLGPLLRVIPAGTFTMGSKLGPRSTRPAHDVVVAAPFAMSVFEVSVAEFRRHREWPGEADHPVTNVDLADIQRYLAWLESESGYRYRLPNEAEWEYAAAANQTTSYHFGDDAAAICDYGNVADASFAKSFRKHATALCDDGHVQLAPVGQFEPNAFGLHDTIGNADEWTADCWHFSYEHAPEYAETWGSDCQSRVVRGGAYDSTPDETVTIHRDIGNAATSGRGFRLVREL